jgi:hypothetical protein
MLRSQFEKKAQVDKMDRYEFSYEKEHIGNTIEISADSDEEAKKLAEGLIDKFKPNTYVLTKRTVELLIIK